MGMVIFEQSGMFDPAAYGLVVGDVLQVICIGGGSSGDGIGRGGAFNSSKFIDNGIAGGTSAFGSHVSSDDGYSMGTGGKSYADNSTAYAAGGAGGYLPGIPMFGGNGGDGNGTAASGLGGHGGMSNAPISQFCNMRGNGNKGSGLGSPYHSPYGNLYDAAGGNGYGAGGGSSAYQDSSSPLAGYGGDAGKFILGTVTLSQLDPIAVTVGVGGAAVGDVSPSGKGADGVVIVTY